jgi:aminopeptidase N
MWFGDLVTMKWWDDLWLNDSFATYMAYRVLDEYKKELGLPEPWQEFYRGMKNWAYSEDEVITTTHPVITEAEDTDEAEANFDGITYGKGASVLKQLVYFIGEENFWRGLSNYFKRYQYSNATRSDFLKELKKAAEMDLSSWEEEWLKTEGTNSIQLSFECLKGRIKRLRVIQKPDASSLIYRSHRSQLALFNYTDGEIKLSGVLPILYSGECTLVEEAEGLPCPDLAFPNHFDYDFVKVVLDQGSLETAETAASKITDPFTRQMIWDTLWGMVRDAFLPAQRFAEIVMAQGHGEMDEAVLRNLLGYLNGTLVHMSEKVRRVYQVKIEQFLKEGFELSEEGGVSQLIYFQNLARVARNTGLLDDFGRIIDQNIEEYKGLKVDQVRRWEIISTLSRNSENAETALDIINSEIVKDNTDAGEKSAILAELAIPDGNVKRKWLKNIINESMEDKPLPVAKSRVAMIGFFRLDQEEITRFAIDEYFKTLPKLMEFKGNEFLTNFAGSMYPNHVENAIAEKTDNMLENHSLHEQVAKQVKKGRYINTTGETNSIP